MMLDIDFFKKVNDTYGHDVGDNVLKLVANILTNNTRSHDVVARFGGEEFVILLPETALSGAVLVDRADEALYEAKTNGRNRVCMARAVKAS